MASSRAQIAELAGVSRQAIHKALRRGWLVAEPDGTIDPSAPANELYLVSHTRGFDVEGRVKSTHRGPGQAYFEPMTRRQTSNWREWEKGRLREAAADILD